MRLGTREVMGIPVTPVDTRRRSWGCAGMLLFAACHTAGPPAVDPDADPVTVFPDGAVRDGGVCETSCTRLALLGCLEGKSTACSQACLVSSESHVSAFSAACVNSAQSKAQVRGCGVRCK